jgi:hypothetical protein
MSFEDYAIALVDELESPSATEDASPLAIKPPHPPKP